MSYVPINVSSFEGNKIIASYKPLGLFYCYDHESDLFIGIDNSTGDSWVKEFENKNECLDWLCS